MMMNKPTSWPPVPGDFEVGALGSSVAICTLGKKIAVPASYAILGTCKTENIGIERVIINVVSNPRIRYLILAGPEVPGHHTGSSLKSLYSNGVDKDTHRIIDASGAIPYIENIPLTAVERFRKQVHLIDMMNVSDPKRIAEKADELKQHEVVPYPEDPIWIDFKGSTKKKASVKMFEPVSLVPEMGLFYHPATSVVFTGTLQARISEHPAPIGVEVRKGEDGTILIGKES
jgi:tetrahydromethanopterin S-methyltransferase subunit A